MSTRDSVSRFILKKLGWAGADELTNDYPLVASSVLNSIGMYVTAFLPDDFGVHLFDQQVDPISDRSRASLVLSSHVLKPEAQGPTRRRACRP